MNLKRMSYYVVEVSFNHQNPIHRAVCFHRSAGHVELFGSYEGVISKNISELSHFRVIEEITAMNLMDYPNRYKLPNDAIEKPEALVIEEI